MVRLGKILLSLMVLVVAMVIGFAYLGDLSPDRRDVVQPVLLDAN